MKAASNCSPTDTCDGINGTLDELSSVSVNGSSDGFSDGYGKQSLGFSSIAPGILQSCQLKKATFLLCPAAVLQNGSTDSHHEGIRVLEKSPFLNNVLV